MAADVNKLDKKSKLQGSQNSLPVDELLENPKGTTKSLDEGSGKLSSKEVGTNTRQPPSPSVNRRSVGIKLTPSLETPEINRETAGSEVLGFQSEVGSSAQKLAQDTSEESGPQKATALLLHSKGASSERVIREAEKSETLSEKGKKFFNTTGVIMEGLEIDNPERADALQTAADFPQVGFFEPTQAEMIELYEQSPAMPQYAFFDDGDDTFYPTPPPPGASTPPPVDNIAFNQIRGMTRSAFDRGFGKIKGKVGGKIKKEIGKKVAKKGLAVAAGAPTGGVGAVAVEVAEKLARLAKKAVGKLLSTLTGEEDERKALMWGGLAAIGGGVLLGSTALVVGGAVLGGLGALSAFGIAGAAGGMALTFTMGFLGIAAAFLSAILMPILITFAAFVFLTIFILIIINNSAYITPQGGLATSASGAIDSPYIQVTKIAESSGHTSGSYLEFRNDELDFTVTYTVTITAREDTLTNVSLNYNCNTIKAGSNPPCPTDPVLPEVQTISPAEPFTFSYEMDYDDNEYEDTFITDTITVTASVPDANNTSSAASATMKVGSPPEQCPAIWPVDSPIRITQGAYCSRHSHRLEGGMEAIDIGKVVGTPVYAGHSGIATVLWSSCLGNYIEITSPCEGSNFFSEYDHLSGISITSGEPVIMGQIIGISGNSGTCTSGAHLHYEFMYTSGISPSYPSNPPYMTRPYIPEDVPRGCCSVAECGTY